MRDRSSITIDIRKEVMYVLSNGATVNVAHIDLDLDFQGHEFFIENISKYQRMSQTVMDSRTFSRDF